MIDRIRHWWQHGPGLVVAVYAAMAVLAALVALLA